ncbi:MAG: hypothetical protein SGI71_01795 [Verrucomicrobiota bacterium]|nr:hypothetical protein [Verrucomicrobiota bacterium]
MKETEKTHGTQGKISVGDKGLGLTTEAVIERRAKEIALSDGRNPEAEVNQKDFAQAERELLDVDADDSNPEIIAGRPFDGSPVPSSGTRKPSVGPEDESAQPEKLVQQGLDEALHDEMIEGGKRTRQDADLDK